MCYICVPTLKLIQAARTKEISTSRYHWHGISTSTGTEEREKANTNSLSGGWNEKFTDRNYVKKRSQNQEL